MRQIKITTVLFLLLCMGMSSLQAQVTIDHSNFPARAAYVDSFYNLKTAEPIIPEGGANMVWDYSGIAHETATIIQQEFHDATNDSDFPNALNYWETSLDFTTFTIPQKAYFQLDESGHSYIGSKVEESSFSITALSGGTDDVLRFPERVIHLEGKYEYLRFPMNYQDQWTSTSVDEINFEITVAGFGLNQTPGTARGTATNNVEVIGYGQVIIPMEDGSASNPVEVLLVKTSTSSVSNYFLGGAPAPAALLSAFGLVEGEEVIIEPSYAFYRPGFDEPVLTVYSSVRYTYRPQVTVTAEPINISHNRVCDVPSEGQSQVTVVITGGAAPYQVSGNFNGEIEENESFIFILDDNDSGYDIIVVDADGNESQVFEIGLIPCTKLPVELLSFEGEVKAEGNSLQWTTASELNNQYFTLSYSIDGQNFLPLQKMAGNGTTSAANRYEFLHRNTPQGTAYYQLSQTDWDGTTKNLGTISLKRGKTTGISSIEVYPTATSHQLNISYSFGGDSNSTTLKVYDMTGRVVKSQDLSKSYLQFQINVAYLNTGTYILQIKNGAEVLTTNFVKF